MKFLEIMLVVFMINVSITLFTVPFMGGDNNVALDFGKLRNVDGSSIESLENVDEHGNFIASEKSFGDKISSLVDSKDIQTYMKKGVSNQNQQYLQAGGDFIKGLLLFFDIYVKGVALVYPTLQNLGVPMGLWFYILAPLAFIYAMAIIQLISGRSVEAIS